MGTLTVDGTPLPATRPFAESMCLVPALCGKEQAQALPFKAHGPKANEVTGQRGAQFTCLGRVPECQEMNCQPRRLGTDSQSTWTLVGGLGGASWKRVAQSSLGRVILENVQ